MHVPFEGLQEAKGVEGGLAPWDKPIVSNKNAFDILCGRDVEGEAKLAINCQVFKQVE
jgi:hypothetical protein